MCMQKNIHYNLTNLPLYLHSYLQNHKHTHRFQSHLYLSKKWVCSTNGDDVLHKGEVPSPSVWHNSFHTTNKLLHHQSYTLALKHKCTFALNLFASEIFLPVSW